MPNPLDSVTHDMRDDEGRPLRRVVINGAETPVDYNPVFGNASAAPNKLEQAVAPEPQAGIMDLIKQVREYLTGGVDPMQRLQDVALRAPALALGPREPGTDRQQLWPERMVRSGATLPGEVAQGVVPVVDPDTGRTSVPLIERAQDTAGMAMPGGLAQRPGSATLGSGPVRQGAAAVPEPAPVFYSALEHVVTNAAQDTMSPQQWQGFLKNQPGVKGEELAWTGVNDWLAQQKGKVKKEDVQAYLDEHKVEIKDVTKSANNLDMDEARAAFEEAEGFPPRSEEQLRTWAVQNNDYLGSDLFGQGTKYSSYQLPGGENYREHLLTLPKKESSARAENLGRAHPRVVDEIKTVEDAAQARLHNQQFAADVEHLSNPEVVAATKEAREIKAKPDYRSSHWDEPNVLAHVRTNERTFGQTPVADIEAKIAAAVPGTKLENMASGMPSKLVREGVITPQEAADWSRARGFRNNGFDDKPGTGKRSLHIEEIQSDWHQAGRKQGYKGKDAPEGTTAEWVEPHGWQIKDKDGKDIGVVPATDNYLTARRAIEAWNGANKVPDAPFKTSWPELALKRMIRQAAEEGFERVSWTPGEAQAARYDLSKQVDSVWWSPEGHFLQASKDGKPVITREGVTPEQLPGLIGKEAADRLVNKPTKVTDLGKAKRHELEGEDLKVGGEGMREFYDKMLPKTVEKIGKAHGVKVKQTGLGQEYDINPGYGNKFYIFEKGARDSDLPSFATKKEAEAWVEQHKAGQPVYYFDLPPSMREHAIGKGFPLYMQGLPFPLQPVDYDPFAKKEK